MLSSSSFPWSGFREGSYYFSGQAFFHSSYNFSYVLNLLMTAVLCLEPKELEGALFDSDT
jgi:hypothetical protein